MVQRLDADLAGPHARAQKVVARTGPLPLRCRAADRWRKRIGLFGTSIDAVLAAVRGAVAGADVCISAFRDPVHHHDYRGIYSVGIARRRWALSARLDQAYLGALFAADPLVAACNRLLARPLSTAQRPIPVGKDRARARANIAPRSTKRRGNDKA